MTSNLFPLELSFAQPWILLFLPVIAVPFILQWLRKRQAITVPWAAKRFLERAWNQTQTKQKNYDFWLLCGQIALLTAALLAVAGPKIQYNPNFRSGWSQEQNSSGLINQNSSLATTETPPQTRNQAGADDQDKKSVQILLLQPVETDETGNGRQNLNKQTFVYLNAALKQTDYTVQLTCLPSNADSLTFAVLTDCSVLILDRLSSWPDVLTRAIRNRQKAGRPIWIVWDPTADPRRNPEIPWFPVRPGQTEDWVQLYETLNPRCPLWNDSRFQTLLTQPIELPSQKRVSPETCGKSENRERKEKERENREIKNRNPKNNEIQTEKREGRNIYSRSRETADDSASLAVDWLSAFENSPLLTYQQNVWIFGSDLAGQNNSLPLSPIWVPLIDRLLTVSLAYNSFESNIKSKTWSRTETNFQTDSESEFPIKTGSRNSSDPSSDSGSDDFSSSNSESLRFNSISRLLAAAGLGILLFLFFQFGRFDKISVYSWFNRFPRFGSNQPSRQEFSPESRWTGFLFMLASAIILLTMAIQMSWTPILKTKPVLLFLIDDSASLTLPQQSNQPFGISRRDFLLNQLTEDQARLTKLSQAYQIFCARVSAPTQIESVSNIGNWIETLKKSRFDASITNLDAALKTAVQSLNRQIDPRRLSQVLIFSDGRQTDFRPQTPHVTLKTAKHSASDPVAIPNQSADSSNKTASPIPVSAVCLGDTTPVPDLRWKDWTLEPELLAGQPVLALPILESEQLAGQTVRIQLTAIPITAIPITETPTTKPAQSAETVLDAQKPVIVAEKTVSVAADPGSQNATVSTEIPRSDSSNSAGNVGSFQQRKSEQTLHQTVELRFTPPNTGTYRFQLSALREYVNDSDLDQPKELFTENNTIERIAVVTNRQTKVLLVSDRPSWEFRYLRNLLRRQNSLNLSVVLQNAAAEYVREDDRALPAFPESAENLQEFDVLILLNANSDWLTSSQIQAIQTFTHPQEAPQQDIPQQDIPQQEKRLQENRLDLAPSQNSSLDESPSALLNGHRKGLIVAWNPESSAENWLRLLPPAALPFEITSDNQSDNQSVFERQAAGKYQARRTAIGSVEPWLDFRLPDFPVFAQNTADSSPQTDATQSTWDCLPELERIFPIPNLKPGVRSLVEAYKAASPASPASLQYPNFTPPPISIDNIDDTGLNSNPNLLPISNVAIKSYPLITSQPLFTESGTRLEIVHLFTDTFWRWRSPPYEEAYNQFWTQMVREVGKQTDRQTKLNSAQSQPFVQSLEFQNTAADKTWLESTAQQSGGRCFDALKTEDALNSIPVDVPVLKLSQPPIPLWNQYWLLILLFIFLFIDWTRLIVWRK